MTTPNMITNLTWYHKLGLFISLVGIVGIGLFVPTTNILVVWFLIVAMLFLFTCLASHAITGNFWLGVLINEQFRMSLSRLQMLLWTVVLLSAFLTVLMANLQNGHYDRATAIEIPKEVWFTFGISTSSLVGAGLILAGKKIKKPTETDIKRNMRLKATSALPSKEEEAEARDGFLNRNASPGAANFYDLIRGEEVSNSNVIDLTRLQNLFFTLVLVGAYAASLAVLLVEEGANIAIEPITKFPEFGGSLVALLGISNAGYLVGKAVDKQPEGEEPDQAAQGV